MPYADKYIESSPGIPHPFHMQAHLATRIGRWDKTSDRSARAIELQRAYHQEMNVKPSEDHQYDHHLDILTRSLIHDGRFQEARKIKEEVLRIGRRHNQQWFALHLAERDWAEAMQIVAQFRRTDKAMASYLAALVYLRQGDVCAATAEVEVLQQAYQGRRLPEARLWETQGWLMCQTGAADAGLKLLAKAVERTKNDYSHHAWGNGAYYMERWGIAALQGDRMEAAEEAFLEALAHDPGSARAALGLQVLCERQCRTEEAARYAELAHRCWRKADPGVLDRELAYLRGEQLTTETQRRQREEGKKEPKQ
jgi:tetratricopeptide (TPR) repeat protein